MKLVRTVQNSSEYNICPLFRNAWLHFSTYVVRNVSEKNPHFELKLFQNSFDSYSKNIQCDICVQLIAGNLKDLVICVYYDSSTNKNCLVRLKKLIFFDRYQEFLI